ncbi:4Fe-4S cluster-binding domain-containing protein [Patescibacteria group bacterium]|nr:4Fe-4S cluster-binding domain-containing protein [Patescibacteria group bacterium]
MKSISLNNKKIFESKLTITTNCTLRCKYCFVNKLNRIQKMDLKTAKAAVDFIMVNGPKDKIIKIYGGEPMLNFDILPKLVSYINKKKSSKTNLTLSLCTNAVILKPEHIDFFKKNNFLLAISFDGKKETHDKFRRFENDQGSFNIVTFNLKLLLQKISKRNIATNISVVASEAGKMFENFKYVIFKGFDTVNLEPIYGFGNWEENHQKEFENQMGKIIKYILNGIPKNQFVFLTTINRELKYRTLSRLKKGVCLFNQFLEVYPNGEMAFSSFFFNLPLAQRRKYIIGNVLNGGLKSKYRSCEYKDGDKCQKCLIEYFDISDNSQSSKVVQKRNLLSIQTAEYLNNMAQDNNLFKEYIKEANRHICF